MTESPVDGSIGSLILQYTIKQDCLCQSTFAQQLVPVYFHDIQYLKFSKNIYFYLLLI